MIEIPKMTGFTPNQVWTLIHCRGLKQCRDMLEAYRVKKCLFDDPLPAKNKVLFQNSTHRIWENPFPLKYTALHLIVAPIEHILSTDPVVNSLAYRNNQNEVIVWAYDTYEILRDPARGGGEVKRFGAAEYSSGTIEHDHTNIISTARTGDVRITLAKKESELAIAVRRLEIYRDLIAGKQVAELDAEEFELVKDRLD